MERFRYLPHTADMRFRAYGSGFRKALENAALALINVMLDIRKIGKLSSKPFAVPINESADNEEELAWFTLQDILSRIDSRKLNAYSFRVASISRGADGRISMKGKLLCRKTAGDYALLSVKAVTPHSLAVKKKRGRTSIDVVIDV